MGVFVYLLHPRKKRIKKTTTKTHKEALEREKVIEEGEAGEGESKGNLEPAP